ncbi:MAG: hypothetical protein BIFFINMI_04063 [Phycisphaerae bacterium]|nr:hypothetical protein [Phycisphaerae bacterium]
MVSTRFDGRVVFRFLAPGAARVQVVGDFTGWLARPIEMAPRDGGWWEVSPRILSGEHRFRYLVDGRWHTDFAAFGVIANEFGQFDSVLVVPEADLGVVQPIAAA